MKNSVLNLPRILFLKSLLLSLIFGILSNRNPTFNILILFFSFTSISGFQFFIFFSGFKKQMQIIIWISSYLFGLCFLFNLNKEWFFISWKYQLISFLFCLLFLFNLRFIYSRKKWLVILAFINIVLYSFWLVILVIYNVKEENYFNLSIGFTSYIILFSIFISTSRGKEINEKENKLFYGK